MKGSKIFNLVYIFLGGFLVFIFSFTLIYYILIPDVCYYHTNKMNFLMNLFYSAGPADNGHPEPNLLNFVVSFIIGGILGNISYRFIIKKKLNTNFTN